MNISLHWAVRCLNAISRTVYSKFQSDTITRKSFSWPRDFMGFGSEASPRLVNRSPVYTASVLSWCKFEYKCFIFRKQRVLHNTHTCCTHITVSVTKANGNAKLVGLIPFDILDIRVHWNHSLLFTVSAIINTKYGIAFHWNFICGLVGVFKGFSLMKNKPLVLYYIAWTSKDHERLRHMVSLSLMVLGLASIIPQQ